jgi:hypothetical protein
MRKFFAVAMGSMVALAGFAGAANASATVDLIWIDVTTVDTNGNAICLRPAQRNCPPDPRSQDGGLTISDLAVSDSITLGVIITAGPNGLQGAGVSVNYGVAASKLSVTAFSRRGTPLYLPGNVGEPDNDTLGWVQNINALCCSALAGIGLPAGDTAYLGTVTFHKDQLVNGTFDIAVGTDGPSGTDAVLSLDPLGIDISSTTTFNGASMINVPEPGALSLLVMGLGGMMLAGRGRRS